MFKLAEDRSSINQLIEDDNEFDYQKFHLRNSDETIFSFHTNEVIDALACNHYFLAPKKILIRDSFSIIEDGIKYEIERNACQFAKCYLTEKHQIVIGCFQEFIRHEKAHDECIVQFKNGILDYQLYWANTFLKSIYFYLRNRKSGRDVLINKEITQVFIGDVIQHIKSAEQLINGAKDVSSLNVSAQQLLACKELKLACQVLAKLYGGRAFLSGNIIEMIMIFEYFKDIYFN